MCGAQAVLHNGTVYVARGWSREDANEPVRLCAYDVSENSWRVLAIHSGSHPTAYYTVVIHNNKVVVVGGLNCSTFRPTNEVTVCEDGEQKSTLSKPQTVRGTPRFSTSAIGRGTLPPMPTPRFSTSAIGRGTLPPMPTPRFSTSAISKGMYLVVAGGKVNVYKDTDLVEIYNGNDQTWFQAASLPIGGSFMKGVCLGGSFYLSGGNGQGRAVCCVDISSLIAQKAMWKCLPELPCEYSSVATFGGCLLAVGGRSSDNRISRSLHVFSPHTDSWVMVGVIAVAVRMVCTATLATGELLVIGGYTESGLSSSVYKIALKK